MMRKGMRNGFACLFLAGLMSACVSSSILWTGNHSFSGTTWVLEEPVVFTPDTMSLKDSTATASTGILSIRYTSGAGIERLPLVMEIESPADGVYKCDTIYPRFLPVSERTPHKGKVGIFETIDTIPLHSNVTPGWTVSFYPALEDDVKGIISLTLDVIKNEK